MANLFIGMGGSGIKTLREIRNNQNELEAKDNHFLFIDTDSKEFAGMNSLDYVDLGDANVSNFINSGRGELRDNFDVWFDRSCMNAITPGPLKEGASALRPQGRASIAELHREFKTKVRSKLESLLNLITTEADKEINIYTVLSVAGGTGSSIYLDLSYLLQDIIVEKTIAGIGINYSPWSIFYMPEGFVQFNQDKAHIKRDYRTNVFATWKEIDAVVRDFYQAADIDSTGNYDDKRATRGRTAFSNLAIIADKVTAKNFIYFPFTNAVLVDYINEEGNEISLKNNQLYKNVAKFLRFISLKEFGGKFKSDFNNTLRRNAIESINNGDNWVKCFTSAGYTEIRGGSFLFDKYVAHNLKSEIYKGLKGEQCADHNIIENKVIEFLSDYLFNRIEAEGFDPKYKNKAVDGVINLDDIQRKYISRTKQPFENISEGLEKWEDVVDVVGQLKDQFNSIESDLADNFRSEISANGIESLRLSNQFLSDLYKALYSVTIKNGLEMTRQLLDKADDFIDGHYLNYNEKFKQLSQNNVPGYDGIKFKDLLTQIKSQYGKISSGDGAPKLFGKDDWYLTELSKYKELIGLYIKYKSDEVLMGFKAQVCNEIAKGPHGDMTSRKHVREMISKLSDTIDLKLDSEERALKEEFRGYANDPLTRVIPDVSAFTSDFNNPEVNKFKEMYQNKCSLSFRQEGGDKILNRNSKEGDPADVLSLEDLLKLILNDQSLMEKSLNGDISADAFLKTLSSQIQKVLEIQNLRAILPGFSELSSKKLNDWVGNYGSEFDRYKSDFKKRASLFCHINQSDKASKELWVSSSHNKELVNQIVSDKSSTDATYTLDIANTTDDVVAMIKMAENLSFESYVQYPLYKDHYRRSMTEMSESIAPHIDVRFKQHLKNYPSSFEDNTILRQYMVDLSEKKGAADTDGEINSDRFNQAISIYNKLYFLGKFYEHLLSNSEVPLSLFIEENTDDFSFDTIAVPVNFSSDQSILNMYNCSKTAWSTLRIDNTSQFNINVYNSQTVLKDFKLSGTDMSYNRDAWTRLNNSDYEHQLENITSTKRANPAKNAYINQIINQALSDTKTHMKELIPEANKKGVSAVFKNVIKDLTALSN